MPDTGGEPVFLRGPGAFINPSLLPGGGAVIGARSGGGIILLDLAADSIRELIPGGFDPMYLETGHILYVEASGDLWAVPFDAGRGEVLGSAVPILDGLSIFALPPARRYARFSVSRNGTLIYGAGGGGGGVGLDDLRQLLVVHLDGSVEEPPLDPRDFYHHRWSPDGRSVVYASQETGSANIFTYDMDLGTTPRQLTFEGLNDFPVWSPDGSRIAFRRERGDTRGEGYNLFVKSVEDDSPPRAILTLPGTEIPTHWPSDDVLIFENGDPVDLWIVDPSSDSPAAREYVSSEDDLRYMRVSPSGDLATYTSMESITGGVIYVRSFPEPGARERVSQGAGQYPFWSPDGNTIYYWTAGPAGTFVTLMGARVQRGPPFVVTATDTILQGSYRVNSWSPHPDGDKIVVTRDVTSGSAETQADGTATPERFLVVTDWFEELRQRMGGN